MKPNKLLLMLIINIFLLGNLFAQKNTIDDDVLKNANDPLANIKAVNVHNYFVNNIYGLPGASMNMLNFRYGQPIGNFLLRATLPVMVSSMPNEGPTTGLGDFNLFGIYTFDLKGIKLGLGPLITMPTGTNGLGAQKWQAGLAAMVYFARNSVFQSGALLQWQMSFAGKATAPNVNLLTAQVFGVLQIGGGTYLRSTGIWTFNLDNGSYSVPLGLGIGKIVIVKKVILNIFIEPQCAVLAKGIGQSKFQIFAGFNTQF